MMFKRIEIQDTKGPLKTQSWILYTFGMALIATRLYARMHRLGWKYLAPDDYMMLLVAACYTILTSLLNGIAAKGGGNLYNPIGFYQHLTREETDNMIYASKLVVISEQAMLNGIYLIKACLLLMYCRLSDHTPQRRWVKLLAVYVLIGWCATQITFFTVCRPFKGYWGVPPPMDQCATYQYYAYVQAPFNLSSDVCIFLLPWPMIIRLKVNWKEKTVLAVVFSLGILVIVAAILTKVFNLHDVYDTTYMLWYTREFSVAVYVSNLPLVWPLMREHIPFLRSFTPSGGITPSLNWLSRRQSAQLLVESFGTPKPNRRSQPFPLYGVSLTTAAGPEEDHIANGVSIEMKTLRTQALRTLESREFIQTDSDSETRQGTSSSDATTLVAPAFGGIHVETTYTITGAPIQRPATAYNGESSHLKRAWQRVDFHLDLELQDERPAASYNGESSHCRRAWPLMDFHPDLEMQDERPATL